MKKAIAAVLCLMLGSSVTMAAQGKLGSINKPKDDDKKEESDKKSSERKKSDDYKLKGPKGNYGR